MVRAAESANRLSVLKKHLTLVNKENLFKPAVTFNEQSFRNCDMFNKNKLKLMEFFFEEPSREFYLRELSRLSGIAVTSVKNYLEELQEQSLITKNKGSIYPFFRADDNSRYRLYKMETLLNKIEESGLIEYLEEKTLPACIVIYGSIRKGEYNKKSDIDLFIQSSETELELEKFEKILKHGIHVLFESDLKKLNNGLLNNIINGICVAGYLNVLD